VRTPFLDHRLVSYVLGIPDEFKQGEGPKQLLVDAMGELLPKQVVERPKMGFTFPWADWMRSDLKELYTEKLDGLGQREQFNAQAVKTLWDRFLNADKAVNWGMIWTLVVLEHWLDRHDILN